MLHSLVIIIIQTPRSQGELTIDRYRKMIVTYLSMIYSQLVYATFISNNTLYRTASSSTRATSRIARTIARGA